jgi:hypothetical protein
VVDRVRQSLEEPLEGLHVGGVEGDRALGADLLRRPLQALGVAADEDDIGALRARQPSRREADAGAPAECSLRAPSVAPVESLVGD